MDKAACSQSRKHINDALNNIRAHCQRLLKARGPLVDGWVKVNRRKCGNAKCRCARGELHQSLSFGTREEGKPIHRGLPKENAEPLKTASEARRRYRQARAEVVKEFSRLLQEADALEASLSIPWREWLETSPENTQRKESSE
jgi:hypothetical protein